MPEAVKVLVVDDSPTFRRLFSLVIATDSRLRVVGEARNGLEGVRLARELRPDVILMDVVMPDLDGLAATREIMDKTPTPIVMVSANEATHETDIAFQAVKAGALAVLKKPPGPQHAGHQAATTQLLGTLHTMAGVQVIHHWKRYSSPNGADEPAPVVSARTEWPANHALPAIVAIVSSTGGPAALSEIVSNLPANFALPVVIAQHIAPDFVPALAAWLSRLTPLPVNVAEDDGQVTPGSITLAPADAHLLLTLDRRTALDRRQGMSRYMPSGDILLKSVAAAYGKRAVGVVLTGMGDDGAVGLRAMYDAGAWTIAQDEATSIVYGMPREAVVHGGVRQVVSLPEIARVLTGYSESCRNR